jgi:hypothetical protein
VAFTNTKNVQHPFKRAFLRLKGGNVQHVRWSVDEAKERRKPTIKTTKTGA